MMTNYGMGAEQVLSIDVVLPNGRFITANEKNNTEIFWALRGGGGATFGVVTGMTLKVYPRMTFSGMTFSIQSGNDTAVSNEIFWAVVDHCWRAMDGFIESGTYSYGNIFPRSDGLPGYTWTMLPWLIPDMALNEFKALVAPLLADFKVLGLDFEPEWFEYDNFYNAWSQHFPTKTVARSTIRNGSRMFPSSNWSNSTTLDATIAAIREVIDGGVRLIQYNMRGTRPADAPDSAINPAWRDSTYFAILAATWVEGAPEEELQELNHQLTYNWMGALCDASPDGGSYGNEGDVMEPEWQEAFYGSNYGRLLEIKNKYDLWDLLWALTAVGSEGWYITRQEDYLVTQTGRLCRKS